MANLIRDCFAEARKSADWPFVPMTNDPWKEGCEQRSIAEEHQSELATQKDIGKYPGEVTALAERFSGGKGISLAGASPERLHVLAEGFARVLLEVGQCFIHRLDDSVCPYEPKDAFFNGERRDYAAGVGLILDELIEA